MSTLSTTLLLGVSAVMAALIAFELRGREPGLAPGAPAVRRPPPAAATAAGSAERSDQRTAWVETILARPLFAPGRKVEAEVAAQAAVPTAQTLPRMTAIVIDGDRRSAIFALEGGGRPVTVSEGGQIGPFTVQSIGPQGVIVLGPEGSRAVHTRFDPNRPAVPLAAPEGAGFPPEAPGLPPPGSSPPGAPGMPPELAR